MSSEILSQVEVPPAVARTGLVRRLARNPTAVVSATLLAMLVTVAILSRWITPYPPSATQLSMTNAPPGGEYLLGGDRSGRDILSRLIAATQVTVESALIATAVAILLGVTGGLVAGYYGRIPDAIGSGISNVLMALPGIIILIAIYAAVGSSTRTAMLALGVLLSPSFYRLTRGLVIGVRNELYVDAARVSGLGDLRIIGRHILSVVRAPVIIQAAFAAGVAISMQAGLEFLGLGDAGSPSWGGMLQEAFANLYVAPLQLVWPGMALALMVSSLVLFGNALRDTLEGAQRPVAEGAHKPASATSQAMVPELGSGILEVEVVAADASSTRLLELRDLSVAYPTLSGLTTVVADVGFHVDRGEILGVVGESGSGKTQTAFALLGLLPEEAVVTGGSMTFTTRGRVCRPARLLGRSMAYIPQEPMSNLDPSFTVGAQLVYGIRASTGMAKRAAATLALDLLDRVGIIDPRATFAAYPHQISGGMAQRVLIAGAVAPGPELLVADEPTTALDVTVQAEILDLIRGLQKERDMGVVIVTHNFGVVADLCDRVVVMHRGCVVEDGTTREVFRRPRDEYTRRLLGAMLDVDVVREPLAMEEAR